MWCQNCGSQVQDDAAFCMNCGTAVGGIALVRQASNVAQRTSIRQDECAELDRMIEYFSVKKTDYEKYDRLCKQINPSRWRKPVPLLVFGIILTAFGSLTLLLGISVAAMEEAAGVLYIIMGIAPLIGGISMIVGFVRRSASKSQEYKDLLKKFSQQSEILYQHYLGYGDCLVSVEYTNPENLKVIRQTLLSGRADTIKEAINILIEDTYRDNMHAVAIQAANAAKQAARGANAAAVFSAAGLFFRK